jgi:hypothetical protein
VAFGPAAPVKVAFAAGLSFAGVTAPFLSCFGPRLLFGSIWAAA